MSKIFEIIFWSLVALFFLGIAFPYLKLLIGIGCVIRVIVYIVQ